jgi:hypothetical protein
MFWHYKSNILYYKLKYDILLFTYNIILIYDILFTYYSYNMIFIYDIFYNIYLPFSFFHFKNYFSFDK